MSTTTTSSQEQLQQIVPADAKLITLADGLQFTEGPAWFGGQDGYLLFSDIPANRIYRWSARDGLSIYREPTGNANGNSVDRAGRLITCEHSTRQVTRTEKDGTITVLAASYRGRKLNSPNDLVEKSDGTIYFTDPPYGLPWPDFKGKEQPANYVFRLDPRTNQLTAIADDFDMPNGLCFSPDEKRLYIADSGKPHHVRIFDVLPDGSIANGRIFCVISPGGPDGMRVDSTGRLFSTAGDGIHIFCPDGTLLGKIPVPETPANCCWGEDGRTLFITARKSVYSIRVF